jgi:hypothetical protein
MFNGNAISQIDSSRSGIHLFWFGPPGWIWSPRGWNIQRRKFSRRSAKCEAISSADIARIRLEKDWQLSAGWVSYRTGLMDERTEAEIFRFDLDTPTSYVRLNIVAKLGFSYALYRGKVVAPVSERQSGSFSVDFMATQIDAVVSFLLGPQSIQYCVHDNEEDERGWSNVPYIVEGLQLPVREADTSINSADDELAKAKSRLLEDETIDPEEFKQFTDLIRPSIGDGGVPRPIEKIILVRADTTSGFEELNATAPLLSLFTHPKWRRVLGFGWFDSDSALEQGVAYEYRITGVFPAEDLHDRIYGFHTMASGTKLPTAFSLGDITMRFSQPPTVALSPGTPTTGLQQLSRRGVELVPPHETFWVFPAISDWSVVIDFPSPVLQLRIDLARGHDIKYEAWNYSNAVVPVTQLPAGELITLTFSAPVVQLRLVGSGFLFSLRVTQALRGMKEFSITLPAVRYESTLPPNEPTALEVMNIQEALSATTPTVPQRSALGFELQWQPSLQPGPTSWPPAASSAPPIESTLYQIEHRQIPSADWVPLLEEENWVMGHRRDQSVKAQIAYGADLMRLFPEWPDESGSLNTSMILQDTFDPPFNLDARRPLPPLGTSHQYRIKAVDVIGRVSNNWKESGVVDLRKLIPPPLPVGPYESSDGEQDYAKPNGVHARVLVKDALDLTPQEAALLGNDSSVVLLRWGWRQAQRDLDPYATEFRVYQRSDSPDSIQGQLKVVTTISTGRFECTFQLQRSIGANALKETFLEVGGYPFYVESNDGGLFVKMILRRTVPDENGELSPPMPGPVVVHTLLTSGDLQPQAWTTRVGIVPITDEISYQYEFRNLLHLMQDHPTDQVWIGLSCSDDQPYVEDKLAPAHNRKGNESPVSPVLVQGRYQGRPVFQIPSPLKDVPRLTTNEPESLPVPVSIDPLAYAPPGSLSGVTHIRVERAEAGDVFNSLKATTDDRIVAIDPSNNGAELEVDVANPDDRQNVLAALRGFSSERLADRYLVFLAANHPYRAAIFNPVTDNVVAIGVFNDNLPPRSNRYVYRLRAGNLSGLISDGDAVLGLVVRVPSLKPGPVPELRRRAEGATNTFAFEVRPSEDATHVVVFFAEQEGSALNTPSLTRIRNRRDLFPDGLLHLRTTGGNYAQQVVKSLTNADVVADANGNRRVMIEINHADHTTLRVWACTLTADGIPSALGGAWTLHLAETV